VPELAPSSPCASRASTVRRLFPREANLSGSSSGGRILAEIDRVAHIAATRHAKANYVTASFDLVVSVPGVPAVDFHAELTHVGHTSTEAWVRVHAGALVGGPPRQAGKAYVSMVAVDSVARPVPVPALRFESDDPRRRREEGRVQTNGMRRTRAGRPS
jgi:acyl-CoA hydrolase